MKKRIIWIFLLLTTLGAGRAEAQLDREYFFWVGRNYLAESKYRDAIEILNVLLRTDPGAHEAYFLRGVAKYNLDDLYGAATDFTIAIEKNPVYTLAYHYRAITRSRLGDYDDALGDFREAIDLRPDMPGPYYSRGVTYLLSQQFERAIEDFNEFLKYEPRVSDAYINKGTCYLYLRDTLSAFECYDQAIRNNRYGAEGYNRRGGLYMSQEKYDQALEDFNTAIFHDSITPYPYFNRAIVYANTHRPLQAIEDIDRVIALDSTFSVAYFNRALLRSQIGDYNNALRDYDRVARMNPGNVLVFYNRAGLNAQLGFYDEAIRDYSSAIDLYPDFANAYLNRSRLRYALMDTRGAQEDKRIADAKIAEYRSKLNDTTAFAAFADTTMGRFNRLIAFDSKDAAAWFDNAQQEGRQLTLLPPLKFTFLRDQAVPLIDPQRYYVKKLDTFLEEVDFEPLTLSRQTSNIPPDSLLLLDVSLVGSNDWRKLFLRGITQSLIRQYTNAISSYEAAIERAPSNPFIYLNLAATRSEMIDFISSIGSGFQRLSVERDPAGQLMNTAARSYNYDEAIGELNQAAKLMPDFAPIYYNRAGLRALSGDLPEAFEDYSRAIELNPNFAEAYYNRGLVQIYLGDTRKGYLDVSKAGELGVPEAYEVLKHYQSNE